MLYLERKEGVELLSPLKSILSSRAMTEILNFFCNYKAATAATLISALPDLSEPNLYRSLKRLRKMGLIIIADKAHSHVQSLKGGPRSRIYALLDAAPEDIVKARERDLVSSLPNGLSVGRLTQLIMDEYISPRHLEWLEIKWVKYYLDKYAAVYYSRELLNMVVYRLKAVHKIKVMV